MHAHRQGAICMLSLSFHLHTQMKEHLKVLHTKKCGGAMDSAGMFHQDNVVEGIWDAGGTVPA